MTRFHCVITIFHPFFEKKLDARWKFDSVWFNEYSLFFEKIIQDMNWTEINKFKLNLFNWYKHHLSCVKVSQIINGSVVDWYSIVSENFNVPSHVIACCIPNRKIRDKYFEYDCLREKYYIKTDFIFYLKK